jgi:hypothetical protein
MTLPAPLAFLHHPKQPVPTGGCQGLTICRYFEKREALLFERAYAYIRERFTPSLVVA